MGNTILQMGTSIVEDFAKISNMDPMADTYGGKEAMS